MDSWESFLLGVAASLAATVIATVAVGAWPRARRRVLSRALFLMFRTGIDTVYENRAESERAVREEARTTKGLKVLTNRGVSYTEPAYGSAPLSEWPELTEGRILLLDPDKQFLERRAAEIKEVPGVHPSWKAEDLRQDVRTVAARLTRLEKVTVRYHGAPSVFRLVITDRYAYISGFPRRNLGKHAKVYRVGKETLLYELFSKLFDELWEAGRTPTIGQQAGT